MKKLAVIGVISSLVMILGVVVFMSNESKAQEKTYKIGDRGPAGGWIFYDKGDSSNGWRYLEAAPDDQAVKVEWGCNEKSIPGTQGTAIGTGKSNTQAIIKGCGESNIAAKECTTYRGGGKSDWFLPSKDELKAIRTNLHMKRIGGLGLVSEHYHYWSSSEGSPNSAWSQNFTYGHYFNQLKHKRIRVRAVRAF